MKSVLDMLDTIARNPLVNFMTRARASFLAARLRGDDPFASILSVPPLF